MKVSIIIPVYGVEDYLDACVESVVNQTYKDIEIFLVDDGGTDNCPAMCDAWATRDSRITVIHKENGGQGTARNAALDVATGDYILFVDSDDAIDLQMVEKTVNATENGKYDLVLCSYVVDNFIKLQKAPWYETSFEADNKTLIKEYITDKIFTGPVCKLFRAKLFDNIRFPAFRANEDAFILHRLFGLCENAYILNEHLYTINLREGSTERTGFNVNRLHLLDVAKDLRAYIIENYSEYAPLVARKPLDTCVLLLGSVYRSANPKDYEDVERTLLSTAKEEVEYLSANFSDIELSDDTALLLNNKEKFKKNIRSSASKQRLKGKIKKAVIKFLH